MPLPFSLQFFHLLRAGREIPEETAVHTVPAAAHRLGGHDALCLRAVIVAKVQVKVPNVPRLLNLGFNHLPFVGLDTYFSDLAPEHILPLVSQQSRERGVDPNNSAFGCYTKSWDRR